MTPILLWMRRDLRLADHDALTAACESGRPVIPVFLHDPLVEAMGAAPKWRLGLSLAAHGAALEAVGSRLILRRGDALDCLRQLIRDTGAGAVWWQRDYTPEAIARDSKVKAALKEEGIEARSFAGQVLFEPWEVETGTGGPYRVYTPFWKAVRERPVRPCLSAPTQITAPEDWPASDDLNDWQMGQAMNRGAVVLREHACIGEAAAQDRLAEFIAERVAGYKDKRDMLAENGTSGLSENLTYGEISPAACWHAGRRAMEEGKPGAETFLKELVWRDFAYHLTYHTPHLITRNWREEWDGFNWSDTETEAVTRWKQGRTGEPVVDAAMRQMYVTGTMHNRARMIVASYLTKHLLTHWKIGQAWFADCLTDWDPASNAMGWQWVAGSGPDAAPFFRIFNPATQAEKFDPDGAYRRRWIAEAQADPGHAALSYFKAIPRSWGLSPGMAYPDPVVDLAEGRQRALRAYEHR